MEDESDPKWVFPTARVFKTQIWNHGEIAYWLNMFN